MSNDNHYIYTVQLNSVQVVKFYLQHCYVQTILHSSKTGVV